MKTQMPFNNEIEKTKKEIEVLTAKLALLKEMENHKTPCEIAYKDWWGEYPETGIFASNTDDARWLGFAAGYNAAYEEKVVEKEPEEQVSFIKELVKEGIKWCEEHPNESVEDWLKPQTHQQVADGLKEAFREAVKQGVVSSVDKPKDDFIDKMVAEFKGETLTDLIWKWWEYVFTIHEEWDAENAIEELVNRIELFLPKEQYANSQNAYVESAVEGFNDCLNKIKRKLR